MSKYQTQKAVDEAVREIEGLTDEVLLMRYRVTFHVAQDARRRADYDGYASEMTDCDLMQSEILRRMVRQP